ncbi:MAG: diadenylate cyclase CdaA [Oscillospiraceae bacterium]|jgi:diadenylate cyclase|nr:diadenylate cyclase CdaA [Oscillospiraceae bacterium]
MQIWQQYAAAIRSVVSSIRIADIFDVLIVAYLVYKLLMLTWETRASQVLKGLAVMLVVSWLSDLLKLRALNWIIMLIVNSGAVVVVVLFQPEIRRALEQLGSTNLIDRVRVSPEQDDSVHIILELISTMTNLARRKVGALIVIEQRTGLKDVIESGTNVDAVISAPLLENIFEPNTPLHDGAVILRGARIVAAGCILTLSEDRGISKELGTRHRAALGITELTDAISLIVSEETGIISVARNGKLTRHLDTNSLKQLLGQIYTRHEVSNPLKALLTKTKRRNRIAAK